MDKQTRQLLIVGDSITLAVAELRGTVVAGTVAPSYVDLLRDGMPNWTITVEAGLHRTTTWAVDNLPSLMATGHYDAVLLMLGGNDADLDWKRFVISDGRTARSRVPLEKFTENLRLIGGIAQNSGAVIVFTDMSNHDLRRRAQYTSELCGKDITALIDRGGGQESTDLSLAGYRRGARTVAAELAAPFVAYGEALCRHPRATMCGPDGAHPAAAAHAIIAETLLPTLKTLHRAGAVQTRMAS